LQVNKDGIIGFDGSSFHHAIWAIGWAVMYTRLYLYNPRYVDGHPWRYQGVISGMLPSILIMFPALTWLWAPLRVYSLNLTFVIDAFLKPQMHGPDGPSWLRGALEVLTVPCSLLVLPGLQIKTKAVVIALFEGQ